MKAMVQDGYGQLDVLRLQEMEKPRVEEDEVLVQVRAASVHPDVWHMVRGRPYVLRLMGAGVFRPRHRVPGTDVAGRVAAVGKGVTRFRPGDEVFGETIRGHQWHNGGAFAEFVAVPEDGLAIKPSNVTFEQAAAVPTSGIIALHGVVDEGRVKPGHRVLVNGAGGGVGTLAVQIAKAYDAHVTGVDRGPKLGAIRSLGADHVLDGTREDFTRGEERFDLIVDVPGNHPFSECRRVLTPGGVYVLIGHDHYGTTGRRVLGGLPGALRLVAMGRFSRHLPKTGLSMPPKSESMAILQGLLETGKLTPMVERMFPLSRVPEAIRHLAQGHVRGKVVITVGG